MVTTSIVCDECGGKVLGEDLQGVYTLLADPTSDRFSIIEPNHQPITTGALHYCSPACCMKEVSRRVDTMWERRRQVVVSIRRAKGGGDV